MLNKHEKNWEENYKLAEAYYKDNGNLQIPQNYVINGKKLGKWINTQRLQYNLGKLSKDRIDKLNAIGMIWKINCNKRWEEKYKLAAEYYKKQEHLKIPRDFQVDGVKLGIWISEQRVQYKKGNLSKDRVDKLNAIGMVWNPKIGGRKNNDKWNKKYKLAAEYYKKQGHLRIPRDFQVDGVKLGIWISEQRKKYNKGTLSKDRIDKLNAIGMAWKPKRCGRRKNEKQWEENYKLAAEYFKENNHLQIPQKYVINGKKLGKWINAQRVKYNKGTLSKDRVDKLNKIGMTWKQTDFSEQWNKNYKLAEECYKKQGHLEIPRDFQIDGVKLGQWLSTQRVQYKQGKLNKDRVNKLNAIGMIWTREKKLKENKNEKNWEENYKLAEKYYKDNGDLQIPYYYEINGKNLSRWLRTQRSKYNKGTLSEDRVDKLNAIGIVWKPKRSSCKNNDKWNKKYKLAEKYYKDNGDLKIPTYYEIEGIKLGVWITAQRSKYKQGKLSKDRVDKLNAIGMIWTREKKLKENKHKKNREKQWNKKYKLAKKYYKDNGDLKIPIYYEIKGIKLGVWISEQRKKYNKGKLSKDRVDKLNAIGMIWHPKTGLGNNDKQWEEKYKLAEEYFKDNCHLKVPIYYEIKGTKLGQWLSTQRVQYKQGKLSKDRVDKLNKIGIVWVREKKLKENKHEKNWEENYKLVEKYYKDNGGLQIPYNYEVNGKKLSRWLSAQRVKYNKGTLSKDRVDKLNAIGIDWNPQRGFKNNDEQWEEKYKLSEKYYKDNGNLQISRNVEINGTKLGIWLTVQRVQYKKGKLSKDRIDKLNAIGIDWNPQRGGFKNNNELWNKKYKLAEKYYKDNGDLQIPQNYEVNGKNLSRWLNIQRVQYKKGKLSKDRVDKLNAIGMIWKPKRGGFKNNNELWNKKYKLAEKYYKDNGDLQISRKFEINGTKLGVWINTQRVQYKKGELSKDRVDKLNAIGMIWEPKIDDHRNEKKWNKKYKLAEEYYKDNGHLKIPTYYEIEGIKLGGWIILQRVQYKKGKLSKDRINKLNAIGMVWNPKRGGFKNNNELWEEKYKLAEKYYKDNGHLKIPYDYEIEGIKLGGWITAQRSKYKKGKLSKDRTEKLNAIGMVWEPRIDDYRNEKKWEETYKLAEEYYKDNGDLQIPYNYEINGKNLSRWLNTQRVQYKQGKLSKDRVDKLNAIGMVWEPKRGSFKNNNEQWNKKYKLAAEYFQKNGDLQIPYDYEIEGIKLGGWIYTQKKMYIKGDLSENHFKKLDAIGMIWGDKQINQNLNNNQFYKESMIEILVYNYEIICLTNLLMYIKLDNVNIIEAREIAYKLKDKLKKILNEKAYNIFILYLLGIKNSKIAEYFDIKVSEVEKTKLFVFKDIFGHKEILNLIYEKNLILKKL